MSSKNLSIKEQGAASAIASFGCVCAGSVLAWTSPVLPQLTDEINLSETDAGFLGSIVALGAMTAAIPTGFLSDKIGRKTTLKCLTFIFLIGWILISTVDNLHVMYFARFLGGFASGAVCVCVPIYVGEIASVSVRGILGSFFQVSFCIGILLVNVLGAVMHWKDLSLALAAFPIAHFFALFFITEPKRIFEDKFETILKPKKETFWETLKNKINLRSLKIGTGLVTFQQLSGVNAVIFYTAGIFEASGSTISPTISAIIVAAVQLIFSCISVLIIEKRNRRFYLATSSLGMFVSLLLLAAYFQCKISNLTFPGMNYLPLVALVFFIISYCMGFGPIPWLMMGEIFAPDFKAFGCGAVTMFNWTLIFVVTLTFPAICNYFGENVTFLMFAGFNLFGTMFTLYYVPETRGKTNSEILDSF